ncbi:MAG: DNA/RNA nuclease SfsA [Firmicutes bacterium HGW-Firmicutes-1]|jgi:sugar fermentation stimulation protein A|nr:MAG: DNA/RNA nuclease SfsA [Firmicutes bacterium HGW-Firmicutes-1]
MIYQNIVEGIFIERLNRFIAKVLIENHEELVHVKNTGRCKELFIPGAKIFLEKSSNPSRKTAYSLIGIYKNDVLINIDSQIPNAVVYEGIVNGKIEELRKMITLKREVTYGNSRFDLYYETLTHKGFIEVKGVTLERHGIAMFPDAPTERGRKHILELMQASNEGYTNYLFFLIQMEGVHEFKPNCETDPKFAEALSLAQQSEVNVLVFNSKVSMNSIHLYERLLFK